MGDRSLGGVNLTQVDYQEYGDLLSTEVMPIDVSQTVGLRNTKRGTFISLGYGKVAFPTEMRLGGCRLTNTRVGK